MMKHTFIDRVYDAVTLSWLTGPIFSKELRISSRRKRNYFLRSSYLLILLIAILLAWEAMVHSYSSNVVYRVSRLSAAGMAITGTVVMVQFYLAILVSVIMLSNAISEEVYHKTLGVLMSTPISMVQVIAGKLLSKLLQLILLVCLTLPILGIVRVFGGVPWEYLIKSFCVTLTAVIFVGIWTLYLSIHQKHAYIVIIRSILGLIVFFFVAPLFFGWLAIGELNVDDDSYLLCVAVTNPMFLMAMLMVELMEPRGMPFATNSWWIVHCLMMLGISTLLFIRAVTVVRKKALLQACGQLDDGGKTKRRSKTEKLGKIHHVKGPPVLWKEWRDSRLKMGGAKRIIACLLVTGSILISYAIFENENFLDDDYCHIMYAMIFAGLSTFLTAIFAATTITSEKASRTWPALLCTLVTDWQIIWGKVIGVLRRSTLFWGILVLHMTIFILVGYIHPAALPHIVMIAMPVAFFTTCSGVFFSSLFKHTTSAVVANMIFVALLWAGVPFFATIIGGIFFRGSDVLIETVVMTNPFYYLIEVLDDIAGKGDASTSWSRLRYSWAVGGKMNFIEATVLLWVVASAYIVTGLGFLKIVKMRLRKNIV